MNEAAATAWSPLKALPRLGLEQLFADPGRLGLLSARLDLPGGGIRFDWSKTHLDAAHLAAFEQLAGAVDFAARREAPFAGEKGKQTPARAP